MYNKQHWFVFAFEYQDNFSATDFRYLARLEVSRR